MTSAGQNHGKWKQLNHSYIVLWWNLFMVMIFPGCQIVPCQMCQYYKNSNPIELLETRRFDRIYVYVVLIVLVEDLHQ